MLNKGRQELTGCHRGAALTTAERTQTGGAEPFQNWEYFAQYDPSALAERDAARLRGKVRIRLVCGDQDGLYPSNARFKELLEQLQIPVVWVPVPDVAHDTRGLYQRVGLDSLKFIEAGFATASRP